MFFSFFLLQDKRCLFFLQFVFFFLECLLLLFQLLQYSFGLIIDIFFSLFLAFYFLLGRQDNIDFIALFKLDLRFEAFGLDPFHIVIIASPNILKIHQPLQCDEPSPLFIAGLSAKVQLVISRPQLEAWRNHFLILSEIGLVGLDIFKVDDIGDFFHFLVGKSVHEICGEHNPSHPPLFQKLASLVEIPTSNLVVLNVSLNCLNIHQ